MRSYFFCVSVVLFCVSAFSQSIPQMSKAGQQCIECHSSSTPGAVEQWRGSAHAQAGAWIVIPATRPIRATLPPSTTTA
jgi:hypothetical protein